MDDPNKFAEALRAELGGAASPTKPEAGQQAALTQDDGADINEAVDRLRANVELPQTGELRSPNADGRTPGAPILKSPLEPADRLKLAVGNRKGNIEYLRSKFEDVYQAGDGRVLVQKDGLWFDSDPENDPWKFTKNLMSAYVKSGAVAQGAAKFDDDESEALGDAAEALPGMTTVAASVAAGVATGGASLLVQGAVAGATGVATATLRTSLGRGVDTYEATPEEQLGDIALEGVLNMGGVFVAAGIKPTAKWIGSRLGKVKSAFSVADDGVKETVATSMARVAGKDPDDYLRVMNRGDEVGGVLKQYSKSLPEETIGSISRAMTEDVQKLANGSQGALRSLWDAGQKKVAASVPANFQANAADLFKAIKGDALESGLLAIRQDGKLITGQAAKELLESGALPKGAKVIPQTFDDIGAFMNSQQRAITMSKAQVAELQDFLVRVTGQEQKLALSKGAKGFEQLMALKRDFADMTWDAAQAAEGDSNLLFRKFSTYGEMLNNSLDDAARMGQKDTPLAQEVRTLLADYGQAKQVLAPMTKAARASKTVGDGAFESLKNQLVAKPGRQETKKRALELVIELQEKYGGKVASSTYRKANEALLDKKAAMAFIPRYSGDIVNTVIARPAAAAQMKTLQLLNQGGFKVLDMMKTLGPRRAPKLLQNKDLVNGVLRTWLELPKVKQSAEQELLGRASQEVMSNGEE